MANAPCLTWRWLRGGAKRDKSNCPKTGAPSLWHHLQKDLSLLPKNASTIFLAMVVNTHVKAMSYILFLINLQKKKSFLNCHYGVLCVGYWGKSSEMRPYHTKMWKNKALWILSVCTVSPFFKKKKLLCVLVTISSIWRKQLHKDNNPMLGWFIISRALWWCHGTTATGTDNHVHFTHPLHHPFFHHSNSYINRKKA